MNDHEPAMRMLDDQPDAPFAHRLMLAAGYQPELLDHESIDEETIIEFVARQAENARRIQFITEDWSMERDMRETLEQIIDTIFEDGAVIIRRVDGDDIDDGGSWKVIPPDVDTTALVQGWDDEPVEYEVLSIDATRIAKWTSRP